VRAEAPRFSKSHVLAYVAEAYSVLHSPINLERHETSVVFEHDTERSAWEGLEALSWFVGYTYARSNGRAVHEARLPLTERDVDVNVVYSKGERVKGYTEIKHVAVFLAI
jgi:hypothetical protein